MRSWRKKAGKRAVDAFYFHCSCSQFYLLCNIFSLSEVAARKKDHLVLSVFLFAVLVHCGS